MRTARTTIEPGPPRPGEQKDRDATVLARLVALKRMPVNDLKAEWKTLYGTDAPYGFHQPDHSYDYNHIKGWVERLPCRAADVDRIFGDNVEELLGDAR